MPPLAMLLPARPPPPRPPPPYPPRLVGPKLEPAYVLSCLLCPAPPSGLPDLPAPKPSNVDTGSLVPLVRFAAADGCWPSLSFGAESCEGKWAMASGRFGAHGVGTYPKTCRSRDKSVHRNPWPYIAGTAAAGLLLGYFLGRNRK